MLRPLRTAPDLHNLPLWCDPQQQGIVQQLRNNGCPQITVADTIQAAGAAAVSFLSGPACPLLMGRPDAIVADITSALPSQCDTANTGVSRFTTMGFTNPIKALTVLSGAHNVGQSRVTQRSQCSQGLVSGVEWCGKAQHSRVCYFTTRATITCQVPCRRAQAQPKAAASLPKLVA